jgi:hypothetical protein
MAKGLQRDPVSVSLARQATPYALFSIINLPMRVTLKD